MSTRDSFLFSLKLILKFTWALGCVGDDSQKYFWKIIMVTVLCRTKFSNTIKKLQ